MARPSPVSYTHLDVYKRQGLCLAPAWSGAKETGVTDKTIRIGATTQLEGDYKFFGQSQKQGMEAALAGQWVQKRAIEFEQHNDFYDPAKAVEGAKELINKGCLLYTSCCGVHQHRLQRRFCAPSC